MLDLNAGCVETSVEGSFRPDLEVLRKHLSVLRAIG